MAAADASTAHGADFKQAKRLTARFYYSRLLPRTRGHLAAMRAGAESLMALPADLFG